MEKIDDDEDLQASLAVRVSFRTDTFRKFALRPPWGGSWLHPGIWHRNFVFRAFCDSSKFSQLQTVCFISQGFHVKEEVVHNNSLLKETLMCKPTDCREFKLAFYMTVFYTGGALLHLKLGRFLDFHGLTLNQFVSIASLLALDWI